MTFRIDPATEADVSVILSLIKELAEYERLSAEVVATEADIHRCLFSDRPVAEAMVGRWGAQPIAFALFFNSFSTFLDVQGSTSRTCTFVPNTEVAGLGESSSFT